MNTKQKKALYESIMKSVSKIVKRTLNEQISRSGYESNDGNGMVGGHWRSYTDDAYALIDIDDILNSANISKEAHDLLYNSDEFSDIILKYNEDASPYGFSDSQLVIYGTLTDSYDETVGVAEDISLDDVDSIRSREILTDILHDANEAGLIPENEADDVINNILISFDDAVDNLNAYDFEWLNSPDEL